MSEPNWSLTPPETNGWFFYSEKPEDWDLARPVPVTRIEPAGEAAYCEMRYKGETVRITPDMGGVWYGPVIIPRPPFEFQAALKRVTEKHKEALRRLAQL